MALEHARERCPGEPEHRTDHDVELPLQVVHGRVDEVRPRAEAGVVDEQVDGAFHLSEAHLDPAALAGVGQIRRQDLDDAAGGELRRDVERIAGPADLARHRQLAPYHPAGQPTQVQAACLASGLEEKLFQPRSESRKDFYAELPISIRLTGGYHEMGRFASGIAALPRIVTLHDIEITPTGKGTAATDPSALTLNVTAKTYRYLDEDEQAQEVQAGKAKKGPKKTPAKG